MEYLLKASAVVVIFYICYKVCLQRDTFFEQNRWFLLTGLVVAVFLPLVVIPVYIEAQPLNFDNLVFVEGVASANEVAATFDVFEVLNTLYLIGLVLFTIRFLAQIISLLPLLTTREKQKTGHYHFIKTHRDLSPFSFFNYIVYNPELFGKTELEQIITHEKVHVNQGHTADIILSQLACVVFWFNPFIWLYTKDLKQNLEFIADKETQRKFDQKSYQKTLLKTSLQAHQLVLTNNFYTSLIKKRIVMLHKSKSKKINLLKYTLVIPILALFLMSFNTEKVYIKTEETPQKNDEASPFIKQEPKSTHFILDAFKDEDISTMKSIFASQGYTLDITNLKRNKSELITSITINITNKTANASFSTSSILPIKAIKIELNQEENSIRIGNISNSDMKIVTGFPSEEKASAYKESKKVKNLVPKEELNNALYILNGEEVNKTGIENLSADNIVSMNVLKGKEAIKKHGDKGKNGVIEITTKNTEWETKLIPGKSMSDVKVVGYGDVQFKEGNKTVSRDSIIFNKKFTIIEATRSNINSNNPLYILDGKEISEESLQNVNPNNIDSINVLKDKSATDAYGEKGKDGVVLITTKKKVEREWKVTGHRNKNVIFATKDTIYVKEKQYFMKQLIDKSDKKPLYLLDGKEISEKEVSKIDETTIARISQIPANEKSTEQYGKKAKNGVIELNSKTEGSKNPSIKVVGKNLYMLNGKEITQEEMEAINPNIIESVSILKGKKATKKYGEKGKNGVIEITLKD